ncbi:MAG: hypothetical protein ACXW33_09320 [Sulfuricurvum sp.]
MSSNRRLWITFLASLIGLAGLSGLAFYLDYFRVSDLANLISYTKQLGSDNTRELEQFLPEAVVLPVGAKNDTTQALDMPDETPILRPETGLHTAAINQAVVTRDGRLLTASDDKTARLWPLAATGEPMVLRVPIGSRSEGALYTVAASPTKNSAVVGGSTGIDWDRAGSVYGFDLATGKIHIKRTIYKGEIKEIKDHKDNKPHNRVVYLFPESLKLLKNYFEVRPSDEWVFINKDGRYFKESKTIVDYHFKPLLKSI